MNLRVRDGIFLSLCAGIGEELLFRSGIQTYLGWQITSVLFVALHGYLNPWNWRFSVYGLLVLPFIILISIGFYEFGLWFAVAAHFSYDAVLFTIMIKEKRLTAID
jgi:membrane protease YdiL (CAAX protease family)